MRLFGRRKAKSRPKSTVTGDSRVEVLETTIVDSERKLVLIRCDRVEHLIMIGGPADIVVENDVRKVRGPGQPPAKVPGIDAEAQTAAAPSHRLPPHATPTPEATPTPPSPKPSEPSRPTPHPTADARPVADTRPAPAVSRALPPIQPIGRNGARSDAPLPVAAPQLRAADEMRASQQRPQPVDPKAGRRDTPQTTRRPAQSAPVVRSEPPRAAPVVPANDRGGRPTKPSRQEPLPPPLPAAQVPWVEPDSIENEIVRALRVEPQTRSDQAGARRDAASAKAITDSHTTLGDLADRLEEALAREVESAGQPRRDESSTDDFGFDSDGGAGEAQPPKPQPPQKERLEKRERSEPPSRANIVPPAVAEAEPKREPPPPPERREEAPVISLSSRRRESADQLEDEMARLLGELTSDTKGR